MGPFKPTIHRQIFIDSKIRMGLYPTTVKLAAEYTKEYGKTVNSRTIAADIASMREELGAPIVYDYQNKGYFYSDSSFHLSIMPSNPASAVPLPNILPDSFPKTAFLPVWQQNLLSIIMSKVLPVSVSKNPLSGMVSVLLSKNDEIAAAQAVILDALKESRFLNVRYFGSGSTPTDLVFLPLHLICMMNPDTGANNSGLVLGIIRADGENRYALLYCDAMKDISVREEHGVLPSFIYAQTTNNNDIEIIVSNESSDVLLVFTSKDTVQTKNKKTEYTLLAQTEIFLRGK